MPARELMAAYVGGDDDDDGGAEKAVVADAERALAQAQRRLADLKVIEQELAAHEGAPGRSIPGIKVEDAVRAVVRAHPAVRRLVEDFDTARRAFHVYEATLMWLATRGCVPDDPPNPGGVR